MRGERLGPYLILEPLGQGGMAYVYRAERIGAAGFRKEVAIKRILPQFQNNQVLIERFAAEARTSARLDHPNIVQVLDFGLNPEPYIVLEFIDGVSLALLMQRLVEREQMFDLPAVLFIAAEAANGIDHAHRKRDEQGCPLGIVHRDLSPQNILISNEGAVKISDFGLVKAADNIVRTELGAPIGKLSYMAPEQARGEDVDARADIFSLGVTIWEMLTLRPLIPSNDLQEAIRLLQKGDFPPPSRFRPELPPELDRLILKCLAIDREERMPSAQKLASALRALLHEHASGYGRHELARLITWLFPEKGWSLPEPDQPIAQPSLEERASIAPPPPAIAPSFAKPPPTNSARAQFSPVKSMLLLFTLLTFVAGLALFLLAKPRFFSLQPQRVHVQSPNPNVKLHLGPHFVGVSPQQIPLDAMRGYPLIGIASGFEPRILQPESVASQLERGTTTIALKLEPSSLPSVVVYVQSTSQGRVITPSGEVLGRAPGAIKVSPEISTLFLVDDHQGRRYEIDLAGCSPASLCLRRLP
ncbi:MAG: serine/threonine-protein kinase [Sandaracinaceae bacterium]|nr:serine/threonine-protein kinase [Sandaracinaceae bacterium]